MSLRNSLLAAVLTELQAMSSIESAHVYRSRVAAFAKDEFPAVVLSPVSDQPSRTNHAKFDWRFTFVVQVGVRAAQDEIPDAVADEIMVEVHNKIMNSATIDGLVIDRMPSRTAWQMDDADMSLCWASQQFEFTYRTSQADIATA